MARPVLSLKAQGLALLARREHSRAELQTKLLAHARKLESMPGAEDEPFAERDPSAESAPAPDTRLDRRLQRERLTAEVEQVLDWLQTQRYQSDSRFVESRVNTRSQRHGQARIRMELARHGVEMDAETATQLRASEPARALEVWRKRFGSPAADAAERAKQIRFLASRGFSAEVIRRIVSGRDDE